MTLISFNNSDKPSDPLKQKQTHFVPVKEDNKGKNSTQKYCLRDYLLACFIIILAVCFGLLYIRYYYKNENIDCPRCLRYNEIILKSIEKLNEFKKSNCHGNEFHAESPSLSSNQYRIVCYYVILSNTTHSRQLPSNYVDPYLCTHIIVGFTTVFNGTLAPQPSEIIDIYKTITAFKLMNPSLKVLLSVSDMTCNGEFGKMVADENLRHKFSVDTINFLSSMNFDGIDLDWEFPAWPNPNTEQAKNFTILLENLKNETVSQNNESYILSVAVAAPEVIIDQSYQIRDMARFVDFINLMSYDYHMYTDYLPLTGPNSPLYPRPADRLFQQTLNINWSVTLWMKCGMPASKINIGIPTYGHSFWLVNEDNNGWNAPAKGFGTIGTGGFITYPDACHFIADKSSTNHFDDDYRVPYSFNGRNWISYDNEMSVREKANYIKDNKFGGAMIYSLNSDDFYGECGTVKFPLLRRISDILS
ncbi:chitinase-3-like protein 2 [Halyomorpha halys]|uniref:chitinase-3-like protein 2 n=1 Tax=Halyomorpha halys TaxID=286706 RepID=UPI0006D506B5|nr:chitinase-3-like protein 2 [Halyomorpha halys]